MCGNHQIVGQLSLSRPASIRAFKYLLVTLIVNKYAHLKKSMQKILTQYGKFWGALFKMLYEESLKFHFFPHSCYGDMNNSDIQSGGSSLRRDNWRVLKS